MSLQVQDWRGVTLGTGLEGVSLQVQDWRGVTPGIGLEGCHSRYRTGGVSLQV